MNIRPNLTIVLGLINKKQFGRPSTTGKTTSYTWITPFIDPCWSCMDTKKQKIPNKNINHFRTLVNYNYNSLLNQLYSDAPNVWIIYLRLFVRKNATFMLSSGKCLGVYIPLPFGASGMNLNLLHHFVSILERCFHAWRIWERQIYHSVALLKKGCFLEWWYPPKHPRMIMFSRKTHGLFGEAHHF